MIIKRYTLKNKELKFRAFNKYVKWYEMKCVINNLDVKKLTYDSISFDILFADGKPIGKYHKIKYNSKGEMISYIANSTQVMNTGKFKLLIALTKYKNNKNLRIKIEDEKNSLIFYRINGKDVVHKKEEFYKKKKYSIDHLRCMAGCYKRVKLKMFDNKKDCEKCLSFDHGMCSLTIPICTKINLE